MARPTDWSDPVAVEGWYDQQAAEAEGRPFTPICLVLRSRVDATGGFTAICGNHVRAYQAASNVGSVTCPACLRRLEGVN